VRIITGAWKGRRLEAPQGSTVRPTSDRLRETLFNVLAGVEGARVLDGFAGTGAIGLEALSRGAAHATFVERDPRVISVLNRNITACGAGNACAIIRDDFLGAARRFARDAAFDLVVVDPPYDVADLAAIADAGAAALAPGGRLVFEHSRRRDSPAMAGDAPRTRVLVAGDSALSFYTRAGGRS
jgi:16S rRNA (guanine966-N2)-methyltransferase